MTLREFLNKLYSFTNFVVKEAYLGNDLVESKVVYVGVNIGTNKGNVPEELLDKEVLIFGLNFDVLEIIVEGRK